MSAREPGAWDEGMGGDREEAQYEDLCEYARAVLGNPDHPHRDDFGGYARETIGGLLKWIGRLESRLSISCQRNMSWRAELKDRATAAESRAERLAEALRHAARELQYIADDDPCHRLHQTGEGLACIALAESLLGPMRDWPEEPNATGCIARAALGEEGK